MCQSTKLTIKNFGPIRTGEFTISKYTILIGDQGTGKSTVAKLYALFTWLEKNLIRGTLTVNQLLQGKFSTKSFNSYSHIDSYYRDDTELYYEGLRYSFTYKEKQLSIAVHIGATERLYKVMYIPAERNILSVMNKPAKITGWPESLDSFLDILEESKRRYKDLLLPIHSSLHFEYDSLNRISWIRGENYRVRLTDASSGYQSLVPLCLVTQYLADLVANTANTDLNVDDKRKLQKEVEQVMARTDLSDDVKNAMLQNISSKYKYAGFVNIVEEMEQNLYPLSQKDVLYFLTERCNRSDANRLILTTHSPYLVNYLSLATKAYRVWGKIPEEKTELKVQLEQIVPHLSTVDIHQLAIYELATDGTSHPLIHIGDYPTDNNYLNNQLGETNDLFNDLLDIEEACQA